MYIYVDLMKVKFVYVFIEFMKLKDIYDFFKVIYNVDIVELKLVVVVMSMGKYVKFYFMILMV